MTTNTAQPHARIAPVAEGEAATRILGFSLALATSAMSIVWLVPTLLYA